MEAKLERTWPLQGLISFPWLPPVCAPPLHRALPPAAPAALQVYLHQLEDTSGSGALPPAVLRVLRSKACRSAIMFGDELQRTQCCDLVSSLSATRLWTICAHGRPTTLPVVHLPALRHAISKGVLALATDGVGGTCLDGTQAAMVGAGRGPCTDDAPTRAAGPGGISQGTGLEADAQQRCAANPQPQLHPQPQRRRRSVAQLRTAFVPPPAAPSARQ